MKKQKYWSEYVKPWPPPEPTKPSEFIDIVDKIDITPNTYHHEYLNISDIVIPQIYAEQGFTINDVQCAAYSSYDDDFDIRVELIIKKSLPNKNYKKQLTNYNVLYKKYKEEMKLYEAEIVDWEIWKKEVENKKLKQQLIDAKMLLKKHNKV